jgi:hypothetical protein
MRMSVWLDEPVGSVLGLIGTCLIGRFPWNE